jgi:hypothetical protein
MPLRHSQPRDDLDLAIRFLQVDRSWYEDYWLKEREPRSAPVAQKLPRIVSCLRFAWDRMASVRRATILQPNAELQP